MRERIATLLIRLALAGLVLPAAALLIAPQVARAGYTLDIYQSGSNVIMQGSGTLDLSSLTYAGNDNWHYGGGINVNVSSDYSIATGPYYDSSSVQYIGTTVYTGSMTGPSNFVFPTGSHAETSGNGYFVALELNQTELNQGTKLYEIYVGLGHSSDNTYTIPNNGNISYSFYSGTDLATLGLPSSGSYVWSWGTGCGDDTFTINVGVSPVPEPNSAAEALAVGLGFICLIGLRRKFKGQVPIA